MKKIFGIQIIKNALPLAILIGSLGCTKQHQTLKVTGSNLNLAGKKFKLYKSVDSIFNYEGNGVIWYDIYYRTLLGDTAHLNVGSPNSLVIEPNPESNYNPQYALADTIYFKSSTSGIESDSYTSYPIQFSSVTHVFDEDGPSNITEKIFFTDASHFEITSAEVNNGKISNTSGDYYSLIK